MKILPCEPIAGQPNDAAKSDARAIQSLRQGIPRLLPEGAPLDLFFIKQRLYPAVLVHLR
jgi:hypothetical protein